MGFLLVKGVLLDLLEAVQSTVVAFAVGAVAEHTVLVVAAEKVAGNAVETIAVVEQVACTDAAVVVGVAVE